MAKLKKFAPIIAIVLGVLAIIMIFLPALKLTAGSESETYSGLKATFGYKESYGGISVTIFKFSFGNLLTYILVIVGIVFAVLAMLGKLGKIAAIVAAVAFLVAGILFFLATKMISGAEGVSETIDAYGSLGIGAILGGIICIIAAIISVVPVFIKE